jgi:DNA-binding response OmpR family regulator
MMTPEKKRKLLLVDGLAERRARLAARFADEFTVVEALDGEMALEVLERDRSFAAVVLACRLFATSGFDVLVRLHALRLLPGLPVLAYGPAEEELKALSMGAAVFSPEPVEPGLLRCRLLGLLSVVRE